MTTSTTDRSHRPRVVIAGGGLGGLTCAKYLAGAEVEVLEGLPYLGGRASTFVDADGDWIEHGLHLFLGTYSAFKQLLREVGRPADEILFWRDEVHFEDPTGPGAVYGINPLHAPLRTIGGLLGQNHYLGLRDKLSLLPLVLPALRGMKGLRGYDDRTVRDLWQARSGAPAVLEKFLQPFCRAIQFAHAEQFSAYDFLGLVHQVLYGFPNARLGGYRGARDELIFQPLARYLEARGAKLRTASKIREIAYDPEQMRVLGFVGEDGTRAQADAYVAAMPVWAFTPLVPGPLREHPFFADLATLPVAPAIAVQLWFDRHVTDSDAYRLVPHTDVVVYQDQSPRTYPHRQGSRLSVDVVPADEMLHREPEEIVRHVLSVLGKANPRVAGARVLKQVVLKHPQHLLRPLPGVMTRRPTQSTPVANLFLAGDWTQQEFFASQEGAVRGGKACAAAIRASLRF